MERKQNGMHDMTVFLSVWIGFFMTIILMAPFHQEDKEQQKIAEKILRFHVLANSDTITDQREKLKVRDGVLEVLNPILQQAKSKEEAKKLVLQNKEKIKKKAEDIAFPRPVRVSIVQDQFPDKQYGTCFFPSGTYEALRLEIGEGKGHNWWCVLYPGLCLKEAVRPVYDSQGKDELEKMFHGDTYDFIRHPVKMKIRWWCLGRTS